MFIMYEQKKILILGMARSGYEAAMFLSKKNNQIIITDIKEQDEDQIKTLQQRGVEYIITSTPEQLLDETFDVVVKNPGIHMDHACVIKARQLQIPVINEVEVAYHYLPEDVCIIGVTGSNGKTTTVTLIYEMMKQANLPVHLAGNIGYPLCQIVEQIQPHDILLMEISDHQLIDLYDFKTDISVLTNLSPTHLDLHGTYEHYVNTKKKIFAHHTNQNLAILNVDNEDILELMKDIHSKKLYFSSKKEVNAFFKQGKIQIQNLRISCSNIKIKGMHNYENIMAAILVVKQFSVADSVICQVLEKFCGVAHRIEYVRTWNQIQFYNDSKSTNPQSTITAIRSFEQPIILILGGYDRKEDFHVLKNELKYVKAIIAYGQSKQKIYEFAEEVHIPCERVEIIKEVIPKALQYAKEHDVILLSPGCASWDQYDHFEERGNEFKQYVNEL